jgi:hypothetical protein
MTSGFVLVDQAACGVAIHDRLGSSESGHGAVLVLGLDGLDDLTQGAAHHGTGADVAQAALLGLARALLRGLDVSQSRTPELLWVGERRRLWLQFAVGSSGWVALDSPQAVFSPISDPKSENGSVPASEAKPGRKGAHLPRVPHVLQSSFGS